MLYICHSMWTKPALNHRWNIQDQLRKDLYLFGLSAHYVKKHGHTIVLHTDALGESLFDILPYDNIYRTLDDMPAATSEVFFAAGKIRTLQREPAGTIHIDGDVFIKSPSIFEILADPRYDLLVQSKSNDPYCIAPLQMLRPYLIRRAPWIYQMGHEYECYNCGVLGFRDAELKREFTDKYFELTGYLSRSHAFVARFRKQKLIPPDLVCEQRALRCLTERRGDRYVRVIIEGDWSGGVWWWESDHPELHDQYAHYVSEEKYKETITTYVHAELQRENPDLYERIERRVAQREAA